MELELFINNQNSSFVFLLEYIFSIVSSFDLMITFNLCVKFYEIYVQIRHRRIAAHHKSQCCCNSVCNIKAEKKCLRSIRGGGSPASLSCCQSDRLGCCPVSKLSEDFNKWKTVFTEWKQTVFYKLRSSILVMPIRVFPLLYRWEFAFNLESSCLTCKTLCNGWINLLYYIHWFRITPTKHQLKSEYMET